MSVEDILADLGPVLNGAGAGHHGGGAGICDDKGKVNTARLGELLQAAGHVRAGVDGQLYRYDQGVYRPDGEAWARARVREHLGDKVTRYHASEVVSWLHSFEPTVAGAPPVDTINVANGLLDWKTGELRPHSPDVISTVQLPVPWKPGATCPRTSAFLAESFPADAVETAWEVVGYACYAGNPHRKAILLLGPGGNGKSTYLAVARALLGPANVATVPVQDFGENRFVSDKLFGKLANIAGDLDARGIKRSDVFKMWTGEDPIPAERKHCNPYDFVSFALPIFSANEAPISSDQTQAWFDRWLILPMERRFEGTAACDKHLKAKLLAPAEQAGTLVAAVAGLRRLMARGGFAAPKSVREAGSAYRERLDTATGFVADACVIHGDAWTPRPLIYRAYRRWCHDQGKMPVSAENLYARLRVDYPGQVEVRTHAGTRGFAGIGLLADGRG